MRLYILTLIAVALASGASASSFKRITDKGDFVQAISGKTLTRPLIRLRVSTSGKIRGKGAALAIDGNWRWRDGYFCRDLFWGGDALGYNCQEVSINGSSIRFRSDRGTGDFADFRLR